MLFELAAISRDVSSHMVPDALRALSVSRLCEFQPRRIHSILHTRMPRSTERIVNFLPRLSALRLQLVKVLNVLSRSHSSQGTMKLWRISNRDQGYFARPPPRDGI